MLTFIFNIPLIIIFFVAGIFLLRGKGGWLIAGWNTMNEQQREMYNKKALHKFIGWLMIAVSASMVLLSVGEYFENSVLIVTAAVIMCVLPIGAVIFINKSPRFRNKEKSE
jgi:hypothetical protein